MAVLQMVLAEGSISEMAHEKLSGKALVPLQPIHILQEVRIPNVVEVGIDVIENLLDRLGPNGTIAADIAVAWLHIELDIGYTCPILASVVLLLHEEIELVEAVKSGAVLLQVIIEGFPEPQEGDTAFVLDSVAHGMEVTGTLQI